MTDSHIGWSFSTGDGKSRSAVLVMEEFNAVMAEWVWKPLPGARHIEVCAVGGWVRQLARVGRNGRAYPEKDLGPVKTGTSRYWQVAYTDDEGRRRKRPVHLLVLEAHVGPRPDGMEGCHNDGDLNNNDLGNLRWDWPDANRVDRFGAVCEPCGGTGRVPVTDSDLRMVAVSDGLNGRSGDGA